MAVSGGLDDADDRRHDPFEFLDFAGELFSALRRQAVEARAAIIFGLFPFTGHPSFDEHALQARGRENLLPPAKRRRISDGCAGRFRSRASAPSGRES